MSNLSDFISGSAQLISNTRYFVDFSSIVTLTLPNSTQENDFIRIENINGDSTGSTIASNGSIIMGLSQDMTIDSNILILTLYFDGTEWRII